MDQLIVGILLGAVILAVLAGGAWLVYTLQRIAKTVAAAIVALNRAIAVYEKSADMSGALNALTATNRKLHVSMEQMTEAMKVFTGIIFQQQPPDDLPPEPVWTGIPRTPSGKPPSPPFVDEYASVEAAGMMTQSDADLADIEFQRAAHERGEPTIEDILSWRKEEDIRGEV